MNRLFRFASRSRVIHWERQWWTFFLGKCEIASLLRFPGLTMKSTRGLGNPNESPVGLSRLLIRPTRRVGKQTAQSGNPTFSPQRPTRASCGFTRQGCRRARDPFGFLGKAFAPATQRLKHTATLGSSYFSLIVRRIHSPRVAIAGRSHSRGNASFSRKE
jgi:hypothetical protein